MLKFLHPFPFAGRALRNLFSPPVTRLYPEVRREAFPGTRGHLEFDLDKCVFCSLCARRCPTQAITCVRDEGYWALDRLACVYCNACVDVCNKDALSMSTVAPIILAALPLASSQPGRWSGGVKRPGFEEWRLPPTEV